MNKDLFIRYFTGRLSEQEEKALLDWIEESEENRKEFLQERKLWDMLLLNTPETIIDEEKTLTIRGTSRRRIIQFTSIAAVLIVLLSISIWFVTNKLRTEKPVLNIVDVPIGQRVLLTLSDGSKVWLNAKSRFSFPNHFGKNNRTVQLVGEALFDVVHNENSPFIVNTPQYQVKVLGTQFDVYAYKNSNTFETTLIQGKVILSENNANSLPFELNPGEQFLFDTLSRERNIRKVETEEYTTWINGVYSFNNQLFSSIVQRLERYYEVNIDVAYPELMNFRFTGKFRYSDPLSVILDVVKKSKAFQYKQTGNKILIYK
ncbi:MAG TPA: FecR domain-containing protein [Bacteroidales bacterium]